MGERREFDCPQCDYRDMVAGGPDVGRMVRTVTISCQDCRRLRDVVVHEPVMDRPAPVRCPKDAAHRWSLWSHPGPCPRCGASMTLGAQVLYWD